MSDLRDSLNPPPPGDAPARRRIEQDLEPTLVVEAAAGTGKTTMLVRRIVAVLRRDLAPLNRLVAVTFTDKAAGEMKLRLRAEVERARTDPATGEGERAALDRALEKLEAARIGTIHSLCADLLRERPVEARVDPGFEVAAEDEARRLYDVAFERWFQQVLAAPPEGVRRVLRRRPRGRDDETPREALAEAGFRLVGHRDFTTPWRRDPIERDGEIDRLLERIDEVGALAAAADDREDWLAQSLAAIQRFGAEIRHRESVRPRDHDGLEAELRDLARPRRTNHWRWKGYGRSYGGGLERSAVQARRDALKADLDAFLARTDADLAACLQRELQPLVEAYQGLKATAGKLDFLDLLLRARDLVRDDAAVRAELQGRFLRLFVDEFQDTDPLQAELLLLLAADDPAERDWRRVRPVPGKLFVVGDPKQSIYRFRRADIALYGQARALLLAAGGELLHLTTSFRSLPSIQSAVNHAFAPLMQPGPAGRQAEYVALEPHRADVKSRPAVVALPVPRPYSDFGRVTKWAVEASVPDVVGAFVAWLVEESGWTVGEGDPAREVPIRARHVCLLLRQFQSFGRDATRNYVEALEARRIPHVLVGGRSFHDREEIVALVAALNAMEWPDDDLAVYATLRGPFFALHDETLLAFRQAQGALHPLRRLDPAALPPALSEVAEALGVLGTLHRQRNRRPIAATISSLLETTRAHAGVAIWPGGEQALANLLRMTDLARRFEAAGATSFRSFVDRLAREAERGDASEAPVIEEGTEGVRIMTVHKAKGLEFPVVILADPTTPAVREMPTRWVDPERCLWAEPLARSAPAELHENRGEALARDEEEAVRLAYVAATRARDLLVVPVVGDEPLAGWVDVLHPVLYPEAESRRQPAVAPGCPPFGADSVYERPASARAGTLSSVAPGLHRPARGAHGVVWWDPDKLRLDRKHDVGLRQQQLLRADDGGTASEESVRAHAEWQARRAETRRLGAVPSVVVRTVSELSAAAGAGGGTPGAGGAAVESTDAPRLGRPHGKRFGILVHAVLATVELDADARVARHAAEAVGRLVGAAGEEVESAALAVLAALRHPLLKRAGRAVSRGHCRRETPVLLKLEDGTVAEGVIDLAFREDAAGGASWTVVDFKTDVEIGAERLVYEAQVALYARAVSAATGEPARGVLLSV